MISLRPEVKILGPTTWLALIASRSSVSPSMPECPRSSRAAWALIKARFVGDSTIASSSPGPNSPLLWRAVSAFGGMMMSRNSVWPSIRPGSKRAAQIDDLCARGRLHFRWCADFFDFAVFNQHCCRRKHIPVHGSSSRPALTMLIAAVIVASELRLLRRQR